MITLEEVCKIIRYPAGESHIEIHPWALVDLSKVIQVRLRNFEDIANVILADQIFKRNGREIRFYAPYFPFSRHDRRNHMYDSEPLLLALELLKQVDLVTVDPHSDVSGRLPYIAQRDVVRLAEEYWPQVDAICVPDAGAIKKAQSWIKDLPESTQVLYGQKYRDPRTGNLSGFGVQYDKDVNIDLIKTVMIVDDCADGGGTFVGLAKELQNLGLTQLGLTVSHGLFTKGTDFIHEAFPLGITSLDTTDIEEEDNLFLISSEELFTTSNII